MLQKAANGVLYLGDIAQYSRSIQQGIGFMLTKAERMHARIICACSQPVAELMTNPNQDTKLLSTLSAQSVAIPPLRSQADDIMFLVDQIVGELSETQKIPLVKFSSTASAVFVNMNGGQLRTAQERRKKLSSYSRSWRSR
jgi:two-component system nitrogen regulation response regulator NtrX